MLHRVYQDKNTKFNFNKKTRKSKIAAGKNPHTTYIENNFQIDVRN